MRIPYYSISGSNKFEISIHPKAEIITFPGRFWENIALTIDVVQQRQDNNIIISVNIIRMIFCLYTKQVISLIIYYNIYNQWQVIFIQYSYNAYVAYGGTIYYYSQHYGHLTFDILLSALFLNCIFFLLLFSILLLRFRLNPPPRSNVNTAILCIYNVNLIMQLNNQP